MRVCGARDVEATVGDARRARCVVALGLSREPSLPASLARLAIEAQHEVVTDGIRRRDSFLDARAPGLADAVVFEPTIERRLVRKLAILGSRESCEKFERGRLGALLDPAFEQPSRLAECLVVADVLLDPRLRVVVEVLPPKIIRESGTGFLGPPLYFICR